MRRGILGDEGQPSVNQLGGKSRKGLPSLAMVTCVRDEEKLLGANLTYHHALGVSRAYLFLDRCTDSTADVVRSFPWASAIPADRDGEVRYLTLHQTKCANRALEMARAEGFEWLLHLDADEFAWGDNRPGTLSQWLARFALGRRPSLEEMGSLPVMLAAVRPETEAVKLKPKEVIQVPMAPGTPFWGLHYFQGRGVVPRQIRNPATGETRHFNKWLGHTKGKSIVRTAADVQAVTSHLWQRRRGADPFRPVDLPTEERGVVYHFVVTSWRHWRNKYRKLSEYPAHFEHGQAVGLPEQWWKEASVTMSEAEVQRYYDEWVALRLEDVSKYLARGIAVRETYVEDVLTRAGYPDGSPRDDRGVV